MAPNRRLLQFRLAKSLLILTVVAAVGCSADRERALVGKWKGDKISATFAAIRLKEESGASTEQAKDAAKVLANTFVEIRQDKSFTGGMSGSTVTGTWTFDKEKGEVVLNITKVEAPGQEDAKLLVQSWTAYLDDDNHRLALFPMPPDMAAMMKKSKDSGGLSRGISLYKK